ncbi:MAG: DUF1922 domain-containing protein [Candidatus Thorarchaeota archaeon]
MEDAEWERKGTPYLVFQCSNCNQYSYVKNTQKSKKCLRCGRSYSVKSINGEIVLGMTTAVETVKKRQNEFAQKLLGSEPDLRAYNDFKITGPSKQINSKIDKEKYNYYSTFLDMLREISRTFTSFPSYVIEVMALNYGIPASELKNLTKKCIKKGILLRSKDYSLTLNFGLYE